MDDGLLADYFFRKHKNKELSTLLKNALNYFGQ
jgi:hypothetical protein